MVKKMLMALFYVDEEDNTKNTILITDRNMLCTDEVQKEVSKQVKAYLRVELNDDDLYWLSVGDDVTIEEYSLGWEQTPCILPYNEEEKKKYIVNLSWGNDAEIEVQECDTLDDALKVCKERGLPKDAIKEKKE